MEDQPDEYWARKQEDGQIMNDQIATAITRRRSASFFWQRCRGTLEISSKLLRSSMVGLHRLAFSCLCLLVVLNVQSGTAQADNLDDVAASFEQRVSNLSQDSSLIQFIEDDTKLVKSIDFTGLVSASILSELREVNTEVNASLSTLNGSLDVINESLVELNSREKSIENYVDQINTGVGELDTSLDTNTDRIVAEIGSAESRLVSLNGRIANLDTNISRSLNEVIAGQLDSGFDELNDGLDDVIDAIESQGSTSSITSAIEAGQGTIPDSETNEKFHHGHLLAGRAAMRRLDFNANDYNAHKTWTMAKFLKQNEQEKSDDDPTKYEVNTSGYDHEAEDHHIEKAHSSVRSIKESENTTAVTDQISAFNVPWDENDTVRYDWTCFPFEFSLIPHAGLSDDEVCLGGTLGDETAYFIGFVEAMIILGAFMIAYRIITS